MRARPSLLQGGAHTYMCASCEPGQGGKKGPRFGAKSLTPGTQGMSQGSLEGPVPAHIEHSEKMRQINPANHWWLQPSSWASFRLSP